MGSRLRWLIVLAVTLGGADPARAHLLPRPFGLIRTNVQIKGTLVDHTSNHCRDRRIYSPALCEKRDLYVYLPPGYNPSKKYPVAIYLHGFLSDEINFLEWVVKPFDAAIACGKLPPMILAAPDGSPKKKDHLWTAGTFFVNSKLGDFGDYLTNDVYDFLMTNYSIRPEPEAHVLLGVSMGGAAAFGKVMKHRDKFGVAAAFAPPLNTRWLSCRGKYFDNFDPNCWGWREHFDSRDSIGKFCGGLVGIRMGNFLTPMYGKDNPDTLALVASENPIDLLDSLDIKPGFAEFYAAYGCKDEFNIDAQVESFLHRAREKGIEVASESRACGRHSAWTGIRMLPGIIDWLAVKLAPFRVE
jgi:pimeloyl-ACP methyl ester carboxylesterase